MKQRLNRCLPNQGQANGGNQLFQERTAGPAHSKIAFGMADMGAFNKG